MTAATLLLVAAPPLAATGRAAEAAAPESASQTSAGGLKPAARADYGKAEGKQANALGTGRTKKPPTLGLQSSLRPRLWLHQGRRPTRLQCKRVKVRLLGRL
jgi:hypothetical protein